MNIRDACLAERSISSLSSTFLIFLSNKKFKHSKEAILSVHFVLKGK